MGLWSIPGTGKKRKYPHPRRLHWWRVDFPSDPKPKLGLIRRKTVWIWARSQGKAENLLHRHLVYKKVPYNERIIMSTAYNCTSKRNRLGKETLKGLGKPSKWTYTIRD